MLMYFFLLCALQLVGEAIVFLTGAPIPGPVIGMALLLLILIVKNGVPDGLDQAAGGMLKILSLLFIPAGVGVSLHFNLIAAEWLPISAAVFGATLLTIAFSGLVMKLLDKSS
ncbi:CidA/LrgA family protein [Terasakiella pusilla]|uniref:CidA/LrgA family protein n=1 Tax=Terasakiella pusilla TaxID=64973 RepID=UPI003AA856EB